MSAVLCPTPSWSAETIACSRGLEVEFSTREPAQGAIVVVTVRGEPRTDLRASWSDRQLHFWGDGTVDGPEFTLIGVDLQSQPGSHALTFDARLSSGEAVGCSTNLTVRDGGFPTQRLTVDDRYVELSPEDLERSRRETNRLLSIFRATTSVPLWEGAFELPLESAKASGSFGKRRILNDQPRSPHSGEDFSVPAGTSVRSPQRGRVVLASDLFFTGNTVVLDHGLGLYTFYAHLQSMAVETGAMVAAGDLIGRVGSTGRVTGPHLHWAVRLNDTRVDPLDLVSIPPAIATPAQDSPAGPDSSK
jgi:murein DD-endopeptidase MepM/ murein hydrolase activator NlpD